MRIPILSTSPMGGDLPPRMPLRLLRRFLRFPQGRGGAECGTRGPHRPAGLRHGPQPTAVIPTAHTADDLYDRYHAALHGFVDRAGHVRHELGTGTSDGVSGDPLPVLCLEQ